jgi:hypothetical protein
MLLGLLDQDVTVNGCVCVKDHRLAEGTYKFMYWPPFTFNGLRRCSRTLIVPRSYEILARESPKLFRYKVSINKMTEDMRNKPPPLYR